MRVAIIALLSSGCAQLFGLDNTTLETSDASPDSASDVCGGESPACTTSSTGRSACGQLFGVGSSAEQPLRVAAPTGEVCTSTEGPCALTITAQPMQTFFDGLPDGVLTGQIDDCGRFAIVDIDTSIVDVAIKVGGAHPSATLLVGRTPLAGAADRGIAAYAVTDTTITEWATQLALPVDALATGFLVEYTSSTATPINGEGVAIDGGSVLVNPAGTIPWAAYFIGAAFSTLDSTATETSTSGTAFASLPVGPFSLDGFRPGRRCTVPNLRTVQGFLLHVLEQGC